MAKRRMSQDTVLSLTQHPSNKTYLIKLRRNMKIQKHYQSIVQIYFQQLTFKHI